MAEIGSRFRQIWPGEYIADDCGDYVFDGEHMVLLSTAEYEKEA